MTKPLFLTGGTGFVGRRVIAALAARSDPGDVRLLVRPRSRASLPALPKSWRVVEGDLGDPPTWAPAVPAAGTVLHLAALTGKATRAEHWRQNVEATGHVLRAAQAAGAARIVFVSSIAAGYRERRRYHYADAKARAEADVAASGLDWMVVRPTLVLGPASPVLAGLQRLAAAPRPMLFGPGQPTQPIHVDDLAAALAAAVELPRLDGDTVELGGPDVIDLADLLERVRAALGLPRRRPLHLPLRATQAALAALEPIALRLLPFTAGQLALFANPSVAAPHPLQAVLPRPHRGIREMLEAAPGG